MPYASDPEFDEILPLLPTAPMTDVVASRAMLASMIPMINEGVDVTGLRIADRTVPGAPGAPEVLVRTYERDGGGNGSAVIYIHGGGFTVGSVDTEQGSAVAIAREVGALVISVSYRLAPEDPFPAGLDDCFASHAWVHEHADELGVDPARVAVVGNSAGGGLAAGLALMVRDRGAPQLCFQFLGIPELDDRLETPSMTSFVDTPLFNRPAAVASWNHYLGDDPGDVSIYAAPARATDLSGLPPAYISTMEFDPLRDEGVLYGLALLQAGVSCELHNYPGAFHGAVMLATSDVAKRSMAEMLAVLTRRLG
jgi:acetyl esterase